MANQFDNLPFNDFRQNAGQPQIPANQQAVLQQVLQNPKAFEENLRQTNPQAYQRAMQIRNSGNPRAAIIEMAKAQGLNPNILKMFGL
jgi:hypothetical protein